MFSLDPAFTVMKCGPLTTAFGGISYSSEGACRMSELTNEIKSVVESVGYSLKYAYDIKTVVEKSEERTLSTRISPVQAEVRRDIFVDMNIYRSLLEKRNPHFLRKIEDMSRSMAEKRIDNATLIRDNKSGFYFLHNLKKSFDPESTGYLLKAIQTLMMEAAPNESVIRPYIEPDHLRVDLKIGSPKNRGYVV